MTSNKEFDVTCSYTEREWEIYNSAKKAGYLEGQIQGHTEANISNFDMVVEFHEKFKQEKCYDLPCESLINGRDYDLQMNLISEELQELKIGLQNNDVVEVADAIGDLLYVVYGMAWKLGIPIDEVFEEINYSNMTKLNGDGEPILREDGKILKGSNYKPPQIKEILENYGR